MHANISNPCIVSDHKKHTKDCRIREKMASRYLFCDHFINVKLFWLESRRQAIYLFDANTKTHTHTPARVVKMHKQLRIGKIMTEIECCVCYGCIFI